MASEPILYMSYCFHRHKGIDIVIIFIILELNIVVIDIILEIKTSKNSGQHQKC